MSRPAQNLMDVQNDCALRQTPRPNAHHSHGYGNYVESFSVILCRISVRVSRAGLAAERVTGSRPGRHRQEGSVPGEKGEKVVGRSQGRRHRVTPHVALVIETSLASGRDILRGIARYVREYGPWSIYHEPRSLEESVPRWLLDWDGDGIIARLQNTGIADAIVSTGIPAVDVLGVVRRPELPLAHVDNEAIARLAADHLLERGFRRFAFCGVDGINWSDERRTAFARAVALAGGECIEYRTTASHGTWEDEQDRLADWVRSLPHPCGVMACNDPAARRCSRRARRSDVRVPDEVAVVGVDNDEPICAIADPTLSSVVADHEGVGFQAAALLDRVASGQVAAGVAVFVPPIGVVTRRSSDVLALADREVAAAIGFIREHACLGLGVDEVCQKLALSRSTLQRRFRHLLGHTIHDEIVGPASNMHRSCWPRPTCRSRRSPCARVSAARSIWERSSGRVSARRPRAIAAGRGVAAGKARPSRREPPVLSRCIKRVLEPRSSTGESRWTMKKRHPIFQEGQYRRWAVRGAIAREAC